MTRLKRVLGWLPFHLSLILVVSALVYLVLIWAFGWRSPRVIYWLAYHVTNPENNWTGAAIGLFLASAFLYSQIEVVLRLTKSTNRIHNRIAASVFLVFLASIFLCSACSVAWWQSGFLGFRKHIESTSLNDRVYHLSFYSSDPAEPYNDFYYLYACDSLDFLCQSIYSVPRTTGGINPDVMTIHLRPDPASNTLALEINGEAVYTYHPED